MKNEKTEQKIWTETLQPIEGSEDLLLPLPQELIDSLNLQEGDELIVDIKENGLVLKPKPKWESEH